VRDVKIELEVSSEKLRKAFIKSLMVGISGEEGLEVIGQYEVAFEILFDQFVKHQEEVGDATFMRSHRLFTALIPWVVEETYERNKKYKNRFEKLKYTCL